MHLTFFGCVLVLLARQLRSDLPYDKAYFFLVNRKDLQCIYSCTRATNNFTNHWISAGQLHCSKGEPNAFKATPYPSVCCKSGKQLASWYQAYLPKPGWKAGACHEPSSWLWQPGSTACSSSTPSTSPPRHAWAWVRHCTAAGIL